MAAYVNPYSHVDAWAYGMSPDPWAMGYADPMEIQYGGREGWFEETAGALEEQIGSFLRSPVLCFSLGVGVGVLIARALR